MIAQEKEELKLRGKGWFDVANKEPEVYVNKRVAKYFMIDDVIRLYFGTIVGYSDYFWSVKYDDGDAEDYDINDLIGQLGLWEIHKVKDPRVKRQEEIERWNQRYIREPKKFEKWGKKQSNWSCIIL